MNNQSTPPVLYDWINQDELIRILGYSKRTIDNWREKGTLPFSKIGGIIFYLRQDVESVLYNNYTKKRPWHALYFIGEIQRNISPFHRQTKNRSSSACSPHQSKQRGLFRMSTSLTSTTISFLHTHNRRPNNSGLYPMQKKEDSTRQNTSISAHSQESSPIVLTKQSSNTLA